MDRHQIRKVTFTDGTWYINCTCYEYESWNRQLFKTIEQFVNHVATMLLTS